MKYIMLIKNMKDLNLKHINDLEKNTVISSTYADVIAR